MAHVGIYSSIYIRTLCTFQCETDFLQSWEIEKYLDYLLSFLFFFFMDFLFVRLAYWTLLIFYFPFFLVFLSFFRAPFCSPHTIFYSVLFLLCGHTVFSYLFKDINYIFECLKKISTLYLSPVSYFFLLICLGLCLPYEILSSDVWSLFAAHFRGVGRFLPVKGAGGRGLSCEADWACQHL